MPSVLRNIAGIDPGLGTGAIVILDRARGGRIAAAVSLIEAKGAIKEAREEARRLAATFGGWSDKQFLAADLRARIWVKRACKFLETFKAENGSIDIIAIESFVDQAQHARSMRRSRWMVPFLTGLLILELDRRGFSPERENLIYQDAGLVFKQLDRELAALAHPRAKPLLVEGDEQLTNEHQRSAFAHAWALSLRLEPYREQK